MSYPLGEPDYLRVSPSYTMPMPTPYAGIMLDEKTDKYFAPETAAHLLVLAKTGGGKTRTVLAPNMIVHPGPAIGISSKDDLMKLVMLGRPGKIYLIDLRQMESPDYGDNVTACRIDPTIFIKRHDDALNLATWLHRTATLSMGGRVTQQADPYWTAQIVPCLAAILYAASPRGNGKGIDWALNAVENPFKPSKAAAKLPNLAAAERAVSLAEKKLAMEVQWATLVAGMLEDVDGQSPTGSDDLDGAANSELDDQTGETGTPGEDDELDEDQKSDTTQADPAETAAEDAKTSATRGKLTMDLRRAEYAVEKAEGDLELAKVARDEAADAIKAADEARAADEAAGKENPSWWEVRKHFQAEYPRSLLPTRLERVASLNDRQRDSVALGMSAALMPWLYESVRQGDQPIFDPMCLVDDPDATLFILAEPEGGGVGAALPLIDYTVGIWRHLTSTEQRTHNLNITADEFTNTLPLITADITYSEGRGNGINLVLAAQSSAQIANRYDKQFADTLLAIAPVILVMKGSPEYDIFEKGSFNSGLTIRTTETRDQSSGHRVMSMAEGRKWLPEQMVINEDNVGNLFFLGEPPYPVKLPDITEFLKKLADREVEGLERI